MKNTIPIRRRTEAELAAFQEGYQMGIESAIYAVRSNADRFLDMIRSMERLPETPEDGKVEK